MGGRTAANFRTIHSLCNFLLGTDSKKVLSGNRVHKLAKEFNLDISADYGRSGGLTPRKLSYDELLYSAVQAIEVTGESLEAVMQRLGERIYPDVLQRIELMEDQISVQGLVSYTDMLRRFLSSPDEVPRYKLLIVDEAQDLNALQWAVVDKLRSHAETFIVAGDDCQAIYEWAGADIGYFLGLPERYSMTVEELSVSHRCPSRIRGLGSRVQSLIRHKFSREWRSVRDGGSIEYVHSLDELWRYWRDPSQTVYFLGRTKSRLGSIVRYLQEKGYIYQDSDGVRSIDTDWFRSVLLYNDLCSGDKVDLSVATDKKAVVTLFKCLRVEVAPSVSGVWYGQLELERDLGALKAWDRVIDLSYEQQRYVASVLERYGAECRFYSPVITVSTIHGVKGGEADIVVLNERLSGPSYENWAIRSDSELRVLYTAITRAKEQLVVWEGAGRKRYNIRVL